ncbi:uncharacterized protein STEHIDRAFT_126149 [Stereum hirsutum FP-91666 SS1]|uniref:Uncharacterized protein n=1 Tax=Stereum hirsutum (strain FP-91666) TaxID=721885 RepID=R7RXM1_STEHR|nr:uncharacterized protein STEHIDRAFT_126149 [Stereum hirsutum FP-91666 SS1]EIM80156.1 hypothetical protein STEHIDRAFT_126149 [Stereum hirsutum FP-91666 SS1]
MAGKGISKGTLNLRFMQNAQRNEDLTIALSGTSLPTDMSTGPTATGSLLSFQDDSKWEVSAAVREAWGTGSKSGGGVSPTHEASYLPFIFSSSGESSSAPSTSGSTGVKLRGRRTWNKKGEEVIETDPIPTEPTPSTTATSFSNSKRLTSISGSTSYHPEAHAARPKEKPSKGKQKDRSRDKDADLNRASAKSAMDLIRENGNVGADMRTARAPQQTQTQSQTVSVPGANGFMKPAGLDDVVEMKGNVKGQAVESPGDAKKKKKVKRMRSEADGLGAAGGEGEGDEGEGKKRKKKRKSGNAGEAES